MWISDLLKSNQESECKLIWNKCVVLLTFSDTLMNEMYPTEMTGRIAMQAYNSSDCLAGICGDRLPLCMMWTVHNHSCGVLT